jgi:hypothetical protein
MARRVVVESPISEITLRRYEKPSSQNKRDLIKKLCLSLGLLQPGDSRDVVVDILHVMLMERKDLSCEEIVKLVEEARKENALAMLGIASSNVRRQLKRLRAIFIVEKVKNKYRITENLKLSEIFQEKIEKFLLPSITERVKDYMRIIDGSF